MLLETLVTDVENPHVGHVPGVDRQVEYWRMDRMSYARRLDHVGITVADLDTATAFFVGLDPSMLDQPDVRRRAAPAVPMATRTRSAGPDPTDAAR